MDIKTLHSIGDWVKLRSKENYDFPVQIVEINSIRVGQSATGEAEIVYSGGSRYSFTDDEILEVRREG